MLTGKIYRRQAAVLALATLICLAAAAPLEAQRGRAGAEEAIPPIDQKTAGLKKLDGFFPLYWDEEAGRLLMEIGRLGTEVLHSTGLGSGLGSNDVGLDRGALAGSRIVVFERVGPKVLMVQPNYRFRAHTDNPAEARTVRDAFARSVLWSFPIAAASGDGVLVDLTEFLVRDSHGIAERLRPGTYRFEPARSVVYMPLTMNFPKNTEVEAELTFVRQPGAPPSPGFGPRTSFFEGVADVAATGEAASLRIHHSFVELPDEGYTPRMYDPRSGYIAFSYEDYAAPLDEPMTRRFIRRHRLEKVDPAAAVSEAVEPIVYYLDPGAPEPVRSALVDGALWWNQAFEAAGYRNAFRVELLPEGVSPLDIRYNVINWVHRSTRGWSTGGSVIDPRTGEIIKGVVTLGSLRIRQDYMLAEGLLSPYETGDETPPGLAEFGLARIRQLSAHEVGHTLGIGHNYYASEAGRISVMDYPHPLVTLRPDGTVDDSQAYDDRIGEWDKVAIAYGYQHFPPDVDERQALQNILDDAWARDLLYMTNQDLSAQPRVHQWANHTDPAAELNRLMAVRRAALSRFGERAIKRGAPLATMEEVLVPLYLHHRYQVEAAASALGGQYFVYALRGDGREALRPVPAAEQAAALDAVLATLKPSELALPPSLLAKLPPRPSGYGRTRELFPRYTGITFDAVTPSVVAADLTVGHLLDAQRAARLVQQHALDASLPGLDSLIDRLMAATFGAAPGSAYEAEIARAVQRVVVEHLTTLAAEATMPQVRAMAAYKLQERAAELGTVRSTNPAAAAAAHAALLAADIRRFLERPMAPAPRLEIPSAPPGAPIGQPAMEWLRLVEPPCSGWEVPGRI